MAQELPYLPSYKNVATLFDKIEKAKVPEAFTTRFLAETIGLKSTGDRSLIGLLKKLGFLDNAGKPTESYSALKNRAMAKGAIGNGIRRAYAPLYAANENAHELPADQLKGLIAQVSGAEEAMNRLITGTFNALVKVADFEQVDKPISGANSNQNGATFEAKVAEQDTEPAQGQNSRDRKSAFNPDFRFNIEVHLPSNGTEETYLAIFNALRKALG